MAHKAMVKTLDGLDAETKKLYRKEGEVFVFDLEPVEGYALENVTGLKTALSTERTKATDLEGKIKAFDGLDAEKARDALTRIDKLLKGEPDDKIKAQLEAREKAITDKFTGENSKLADEAKRYKTQLESALLEGSIKDALVKHKGNVALLLPHVRSRVSLKQEGEKMVAIVPDEKGGARISSAKGSTANMSVDELVEEMSKSADFSAAFAGSGKSGSKGPLNVPPENNNNAPRRSDSGALIREAVGMNGG